jgi:phage tail sheath protein FI
MATGYQTPGVYREEVILKSPPELQTGVPGFVGFVISESADLFSEPVLLNRSNEFDARFEKKHLPNGTYLADAVHGFFSNGGARCYVVVAGYRERDTDGSNEKTFRKALDSLASLTDLDVIAAPDVMMLLPAAEAVKRMQIEMLKHCQEHGNRFAILDALPKDISTVIEQRNHISKGLREPVNGALYYPWLVLPEQPESRSLRNNRKRMLPPSGHVAGIFGRSDARVGVFKAPANEEIIGAMDLCVGKPEEFKEININNQLQDQLNPEGINCLRAFPGRGIRVWGARSLSREQDWRYVSVCRLVITLRRWIDINMTWATFEPNTPQLWVRIHRELTVYLTDLWRAGALAGATADEAFQVKCDSETNSQEVIDAGHVMTDIALAPGRPAEFVIVRVVHQIGVEPR